MLGRDFDDGYVIDKEIREIREAPKYSFDDKKNLKILNLLIFNS
jgi:hypothetical protein